MALTTVSSDRLATNVKNTNFTAAEKQDLTNDILPLATQFGQSKNLIINGAMQVAQRGTASTSVGFQTCDRWYLAYGGTDEAPEQRQANLGSGDTGPYEEGFRKAFKITNGNQTSGAGAADYIAFLTSLEAQELANSGWNYTDPNSKLTIQFWAKSSVAKTFTVQLYTVDGTSQAYNHKYVLAANTWTKVIHTFPGYANVQFDNDANKGIEIQWNMFSGTNYTSGSTVDQWLAYSGSTSTPDDTSDWYTTNDATFEITGVQLEVGSTATEFEHRSSGQELALCQRYFVSKNVCLGVSYNGEGGNVTYTSRVDFNPTMRVDPTITFPTNYSATNTNSDVANGISKDGFSYGANVVSSGNYFRQSLMNATAEL